MSTHEVNEQKVNEETVTEEVAIEEVATEEAPKQDLTVEERLLNMEENFKYIKELLVTNNQSYEILISSLGKLMEKDKIHKDEVTEWADTVEERIGRIMVEHVNLSLIIGETIVLTAEQKRNIENKVKALKVAHLEKEKGKKKEPNKKK